MEGYTPDTGWAIGRGEEYADSEQHDSIEANALYTILEQEIVPLFYERGADGIAKAYRDGVEIIHRQLLDLMKTEVGAANSAVYLDCLSETPPFKMSGTWHELPITIEWVPRDYFTLTTLPDSQVDQLIVALKEVLGFMPAISYIDPGGNQIVEWHMQQANQRIQSVQGDPNFHHIKRYK